MKTYEGVEVELHEFVNRGTMWRWVVNFTPRSLHPREKDPSTHY